MEWQKYIELPEKQGNKESIDRFNPYVSKHCMHVKREHLPIKIPRTEGD